MSLYASLAVIAVSITAIIGLIAGLFVKVSNLSFEAGFKAASLHFTKQSNKELAMLLSSRERALDGVTEDAFNIADNVDAYSLLSNARTSKNQSEEDKKT